MAVQLQRISKTEVKTLLPNLVSLFWAKSSRISSYFSHFQLWGYGRYDYQPFDASKMTI